MGSTFGTLCKISIFGESHGPAIGVCIDGFPSGIAVDPEFVDNEMRRRRPSNGAFSTSRKEKDEYEILSGVLDGITTGSPISAIIRNTNQHSGDYEELRVKPRPSHADYTATLRYGDYNDVRGGGHFSGRITAPLVFAGALCKLALKKYGVNIVAHIANIGCVYDAEFDKTNITTCLSDDTFPLIDETKKSAMLGEVESARAKLDSVGGSIECAVINPPLGLGSPMFGGVENVISTAVFGVPAVKGIEFGAGFRFCEMNGSCANDAMFYDGDTILTRTNNNSGILGGITNGMPIVFRAAIKPTASIASEQSTVNMLTHQDDKLSIKGRHDPCIVPRAVPVIEAATALAMLDLTLMKYGYDKK